MSHRRWFLSTGTNFVAGWRTCNGAQFAATGAGKRVVRTTLVEKKTSVNICTWY